MLPPWCLDIWRVLWSKDIKWGWVGGLRFLCLILSFHDWACYRAGDVFDSFLEANPDDPDMCPCLQFLSPCGDPYFYGLFYMLMTRWVNWWCDIIPVASSCQVKRPSLEAPRGSKISVKEVAGELRILFPPPSWSSLVGPGTFTVAWVTFTAVWTAGVVSAGAPLMSLFSLLTGMQVILPWPLPAQSHYIRSRTVCSSVHLWWPFYWSLLYLFQIAMALSMSGCIDSIYSHFRSFRILCQHTFPITPKWSSILSVISLPQGSPVRRGLPFWNAGGTMLRDTFSPLIRGAVELRIRDRQWTLRILTSWLLMRWCWFILYLWVGRQTKFNLGLFLIGPILRFFQVDDFQLALWDWWRSVKSNHMRTKTCCSCFCHSVTVRFYQHEMSFCNRM